MNITNSFLSSVRALNKNKMRSALTSVGIIIGVSSVIIMVGMGSSARIAVKSKITTYGTNAMSIYDSKRPLSTRDIDNLRTLFQVKFISPVLYDTYIPTKFMSKNMLSRIFGVNVDFFHIKEWNLLYGRYFTDIEIRSFAKVVIIGETVRQELFGTQNPIGKTIIIRNVPFQVVGVLVEMGQAFSGRDFDNLMIVPYTTCGVKLFNRRGFDEIYVATHTESMVDETVELVEQYFRRVHSIPHGSPNDFKIKTSKEKLTVANEISNTLSILLAGIASISLFVGGVGIMNIMLVSVSERTREIGIRMAIGAKRRDILLQFLIESVTLSSVGGIVGIALGLAVYYVIIYFVKWPFLFSAFSVLISFFFAFAVGIFFGFYPARKASNLKPIEALRYE
ncbi:MAG TPA: ABC transporter permease [Spirochaetota bacterium]|nr:ABC transporter permease [Spirochaetota bacterium]